MNLNKLYLLLKKKLFLNKLIYKIRKTYIYSIIILEGQKQRKKRR